MIEGKAPLKFGMVDLQHCIWKLIQNIRVSQWTACTAVYSRQILWWHLVNCL